MSELEEYTRMNTRPASLVHVGGFRPTGDVFASNFGLRALGTPGEAWPASNGRPLLFVCQLNLTAAPVVPDLLKDFQLLTFFANLDGELGRENGDDWRVFAYPTLDGLTAMSRPDDAPTLSRGFECRWEACEDHPNYDDPDRVVPEGFDDSEVQFENAGNTKVGGYLSTIQSEPWWSTQDHPAKPVYCFQVNSEEKVALAWGDAGAVYLARGTAEGAGGQWFLDWQCY